MPAPLVFPDPIVSLSDISGAAFLYFDGPLILGLPAAVIPPVGEQSFRMMELVSKRRPAWADVLYFALEQARQQAMSVNSVQERLASISKGTLTNVYFSYPAGEDAWAAATEAATRVAERSPGVASCLAVGTAASDLRRHIFLESFLNTDGDVSALYEYCEGLFTKNALEHLLLSAYLLRLTALQQITATAGLLLTNPRAVELVAAAVPDADPAAPADVVDVVAWQIFRQIISPRLDPLSDDRIALINDIRSKRLSERTALVDRCRDIAATLVRHHGTVDPETVRRHVETRVEPEIAALLALDKKALRSVIDELLSDKATWISLAGLISGVVSGTQILSVTGAVAALSALGAAAYKVGVKNRSTLAASNLRMVYSIERRT